MVDGAQGTVVAAGEGQGASLQFGNRLEVKASAASGMKFGFFRSSLPKGAGWPFLHLHRSHDEAIYVVDGEVEFRLGDRYVTAHAGAGVLLPAGVPHCFKALEESTLVAIVSPADAVDMVVELAGADGDPSRFAEILTRYDTELLEQRPHWAPAT